MQSLKGVYYLLVKKSAGDAPILIALSTVLSQTEGPRANTDFIPEEFMERLTQSLGEWSCIDCSRPSTVKNDNSTNFDSAVQFTAHGYYLTYS